MRLVIALGGNALLRRGEAMTAENQRENVRVASVQMAKVAPGNQLVIAHGNGPQAPTGVEEHNVDGNDQDKEEIDDKAVLEEQGANDRDTGEAGNGQDGKGPAAI